MTPGVEDGDEFFRHNYNADRIRERLKSIYLVAGILGMTLDDVKSLSYSTEWPVAVEAAQEIRQAGIR